MDNLLVLNRIITGIVPVILLGKTYYFHDPSHRIRYEAEIYHQYIYNELLMNGVMTKEESLEVLTKRGIWNNHLENEIVKIQEDIQKFKKSLPNYEYQSLEKQRIESQKRM